MSQPRPAPGGGRHQAGEAGTSGEASRAVQLRVQDQHTDFLAGGCPLLMVYQGLRAPPPSCPVTVRGVPPLSPLTTRSLTPEPSLWPMWGQVQGTGLGSGWRVKPQAQTGKGATGHSCGQVLPDTITAAPTESKAAVTQEKWVVGRAACCGRDLGGRERRSTHLSLHPAVVSRLHPPPQHLDRLAPGCQTLSFSFGSKTPRRTKPQVQVSRLSGGRHEPSPQPLPGSRATDTREDKALWGTPKGHTDPETLTSLSSPLVRRSLPSEPAAGAGAPDSNTPLARGPVSLCGASTHGGVCSLSLPILREATRTRAPTRGPQEGAGLALQRGGGHGGQARARQTCTLPDLHGVQGEVAGNLKLLPEDLLLDVINADELGHPPRQDALAVRRVAQSGEGPETEGTHM